MENLNRAETVWRAGHIPNVVLTSRIRADWMANWLEEEATCPMESASVGPPKG